MPTPKESIIAILYGQPIIFGRALAFTFHPAHTHYDTPGRFHAWNPEQNSGHPLAPDADWLEWYEDAQAHRYFIWPDEFTRRRDSVKLNFALAVVQKGDAAIAAYQLADVTENHEFIERVEQVIADGVFYDTRPGTTAPDQTVILGHTVSFLDPWLSYFNGDWSAMPHHGWKPHWRGRYV